MKSEFSMKVTRVGVFCALAMCFSYIEVLIPLSIGIPGVKLGIANLVVLVALCLFDEKQAFGISIFRIVIMGILFGNGVSFIYSLAGGLFSFASMVLVKKTGKVSILGISVVGGTMHNVGQILAARVVLGSNIIFGYFPVLMTAGVITGAILGAFVSPIINRLKNIYWFMENS